MYILRMGTLFLRFVKFVHKIITLISSPSTYKNTNSIVHTITNDT